MKIVMSEFLDLQMFFSAAFIYRIFFLPSIHSSFLHSISLVNAHIKVHYNLYH